MPKTKTTDVLTSIVDLLEPMESEDRVRIINAALALLGESASPAKFGTGTVGENAADLGEFSPRAGTWMKQYGISAGELEQVFSVVDGVAEVIATHMPGKDKKEQTYNAYVLTGISKLLSSGVLFFEDKAARALCESSGCYDAANHSTHLKKRKREALQWSHK